MTEKDNLSTESYKGVRDFYPEDEAVQKYLFATMRAFVEKRGYIEYHASILEPAELYRGKQTENEEILGDQTYTFVDRGEREVTLRPEMTPTVARMVAMRRRELSFPLRWYSIPNIFRYERPQKGRLREHWQLNVDLFGSHSPAADAEVITMAHGLMRAFGAHENDFTIRVSSRKFLRTLTEDLRIADDHALVQKFLRLMDARAKIPEREFESAMGEMHIPLEKLSPSDEPEDVAAVLGPLRKAGFGNISFDPSVVRGFNYYTGVVFEVFDTHPENNRSLFGGGRYDHLLERFGGEEVPAVGFGMGDVTIREFLAARELLPPYTSPVEVYVAVTGPDMVEDATTLADSLREQGVSCAVDFGDKKLGDQIRAADRQHIPYLIVVGKDEVASGKFIIKNLATRVEKSISQGELGSFFLSA